MEFERGGHGWRNEGVRRLARVGKGAQNHNNLSELGWEHTQKGSTRCKNSRILDIHN